MMQRRNFLVCAALLSGGGLARLHADWSRFRGPNGNGVAEAVALAWHVPLTKQMAWKTVLPGSGHGSPVYWGGKIYLQAASNDGKERQLLRLDAGTGNVDWSVRRAGEATRTHKKNSLASSTPCVDAQRVYVVVWDGRDVWGVAYDHDGKQLWECKLGGYVSQHGLGMSPVVHENFVYLNYDQDGSAELVALHAATGEIAWRAPRKAFRACYSSPLVYVRGGVSEILNASTAGVTAYEPATGKVVQEWPWKFDGMALRTVGAPVLSEHYLVVYSGDGGGSRSMAVLDLNTPMKAIWEKRRDVPYVPSPVVRGDYIYCVTDGGLATCTELKTGKLVWNERCFSRAVSASLILVGDQILALAEDGKAVAFAASKLGFEKTGETDFRETIIATPAVGQGKVFVRTSESLYAIGR